MTAIDLPCRFTITGLHPVEADGHVWLGQAVIRGASFHCQFVRVVTDEESGEQGVPPDATDDTRRTFEDMQAFYDGVYETVALPGVDGRFAAFFFPFCG